jgi:hypothetical protein
VVEFGTFQRPLYTLSIPYTSFAEMKITQTDKAVLIACGTTFLTFLMNAKLGSIWILYLNVFMTACVFGYAIRQWDEFSHLSRSVIFGVSASITYTPVDWLLSRQVRLIFYLRSDIPWMFAVPLSLLLMWMVAITVSIYLYQRLNSMGSRSYISAGITGIAVFVGSTVLDQFGSARLWNWNAMLLKDSTYIGSVPIFVPIALFLTFLLSPYYFYRHHIIVAGIRCGIFMGTMQFLCFVLFRFMRI